MPAKPTTLPLWATDGGTTLEPSSGEKAAGFAVSTRPPARWFNWILNLLYQWMQYLNAPVGASAATGGAAIDATGGVGSGGTGGPGLKGTGGATNANGVEGVGAGTGAGVKGTAAGATGIGVQGVGVGAGIAVYGSSGTAGIGVRGFGGTSGAIGVKGDTNIQDSWGVYGLHSGNATGEYGGVMGEATGAGYGVIAKSDTSSPGKSALRVVPQDDDPVTTPAAGDAYVHTSSGKPSVYNGAEWGRVLTRVYALLADEDKSASGQFAAAYTIGAGKLRPGTRIKVRVGASVSAYTSGDVTLGLRFDGTTIITTPAWTAAANDDVVLEMEVVIRSKHASTGAWAANGVAHYDDTTADAKARHQSTRLTSQDTTAAKTIDVDLTLSGTATVRLHSMTVEISD